MESIESLRPFFEPRGVVIVGARRKPGFGYGIPIMLERQGWGDRMFLVSPSGGELHGRRVYQDLAEVPGPVDLAVVIVPAAVVPEALARIGEQGIRHAVVESAGFAETGEAGRRLQEQALAAARSHGLRVMGPNCVGVVNCSNRFSTVEVVEEALKPGSTAIIAQSGVFGNCLLDKLPAEKLFISKAATLGNKMDVNECDMLEYLGHDSATRAIMMYLEGASDGQVLRRVLRQTAQQKPVLVLKSGRTESGRSATASHTGSQEQQG